MSTAPSGNARSRRAEYAAATRQAIYDAARELFSRKGFFTVTVEEIATAARVAPATVYAVGGGKQGLLKLIIEARTTAPDVADIHAHLAAATDAGDLLRDIVNATRVRFERSRDLMRVIADTAPHDPGAAGALKTAEASLRDGLAVAAGRLSELGALRAGLGVQEATDVLFFYLNNDAYFTLTDHNGWSLDRAECWLRESLHTALLDS
ncbi:helix-turn-helix domain-containing protein [Amycolatopsis sp. NPDC051102]|uniref:TetR/AcrR family transcriptional regulator n=1 Tax=Amycolatopsis sp. NPDC051102 TaxID=3155163 RepID=UPI003412D66F